MLGSAVPATPSLYTATTGATPTSPTRPSRLRGLSYLRSYTQNHLHSSAVSRADAPTLTRSSSSPVHYHLTASAHRDSTEPRPPEQTLAVTTGRQGEGWIPTVQGRSGLDRESLNPTATAPPFRASETPAMTRNRAATIAGSAASAGEGASALESTPVNGTMIQSVSSPQSNGKEQLPTIRLIPHVEARSSRPSLQFSAVTRILKSPNSTIRVGRYSERDTPSTDPASLPVGFKSKVVSRRHCEFWFANGQWYIKDVKSSSGTFLNHVRLSSAGVESRPFPVNDGDVVQLGIDFKGGEEVIFRCVKIRVECNRGWQKSLNNFNTTAHKQLLKSALVGKPRDSDTQSVNTSECSICLNAVAPCQALFVAPCSHVWHYKCIRNLLHGPSWPNFLCPNCRFVADLEAEIEQPEDDGFEDEEEMLAKLNSLTDDQRIQDPTSSEDSHDGHRENGREASDSSRRTPHASRSRNSTDDELADLLGQTSLSSRRPPANEAELLHFPDSPQIDSNHPSSPIEIAPSSQPLDPFMRMTTPPSNVQFALAAGSPSEALMTPRNDAGPFVLDGAGSDRIGHGLAAQILPEIRESATHASDVD